MLVLGRLQTFSDVTLVCADGKQINAHKIILATASPFFYNIFQTNNHPNPLIYMKGLKWSDVSDIIDFIYHGEISLAQQNITEFLETAEDLKLKGLSKSSYIDMLENEQLENDETQKGNIEHTAKENNIVQSIKSEPLKIIQTTSQIIFLIHIPATIAQIAMKNENLWRSILGENMVNTKI